ncbi:hypothetical protein FQZ97_771030 [compost metagenome]
MGQVLQHRELAGCQSLAGLGVRIRGRHRVAGGLVNLGGKHQASAEDHAHRLVQFLQCGALVDEAAGPGVQAQALVVRAGEVGEDQQFLPPIPRPQPADQLQSAQARQLQFEYHQLGVVALDQRQGVPPVAGLAHHLVPGGRQALGQCAANEGLWVGDHYGAHGAASCLRE